jgi:hypothetical protein
VANPTTNYGFVLPTPTDLVTDLPADFDVALQGVDTRLKALQPGTTAGDLAYSSATANTNTRLPIGTANQVLRVNSGATAPEWATPSPGKVVQIVTATTNTQVSNATTTHADTTLTATITPTSASNKVLIFISQNGLGKTGGTSLAYDLRLLRGATNIAFPVYQGGIATGVADVYTNAASFAYLDSPATTSATTYKTQIKATSATFAVHVQYYNPDSSIVLMEVTP